MYDIFNALKATPYRSVKAVILGQDPYHGPGQAHGMCFSVKKGVDVPPSLQNIFKELHDDIGFEIPPHGCLEQWAASGVLLLNKAQEVLDKEFPEIAKKLELHIPDESSRRVGQSVAAASLPNA